MLVGPENNADLTRHVICRADEMAWEPTTVAGVRQKNFERMLDPAKGRETGLLRLEPGASLGEAILDERTEFFVLEGELSDGHGSYTAGVYVRNPPGTAVNLATTAGATVLVKRRVGVGRGGPRIVRDATKRENWQAWGERGSEKVQLYDAAEIKEASWIGYMLPDLRIPEHDHAGGEEIFVLEGSIEDETGVARPRTWIRFPVGFRHSPFSHGQGCKMIVREGDVLPG
jgi:anti-sigma factor ChrR (cupin superfamily)